MVEVDNSMQAGNRLWLKVQPTEIRHDVHHEHVGDLHVKHGRAEFLVLAQVISLLRQPLLLAVQEKIPIARKYKARPTRTRLRHCRITVSS